MFWRNHAAHAMHGEWFQQIWADLSAITTQPASWLFMVVSGIEPCVQLLLKSSGSIRPSASQAAFYPCASDCGAEEEGEQMRYLVAIKASNNTPRSLFI
jgi:hypothetical protein